MLNISTFCLCVNNLLILFFNVLLFENRRLDMQTSTLKEYCEKLGNCAEARRRLGLLSNQALSNALRRSTKIYVEHDNNLNPTNCFIKKGWGKFKTTN